MSATGATILGCAGPVLDAREAAFFRDADPWGFILFARNVADPDQIRALTAHLRESVGRDAPIFIDQEGGRVARLGPPQWRAWLPPLDHAQATGAAAPRAFWLRYRLIAEELRALGIDGNCAPTCDVAMPATHPFLRNRCLADDAARVAAIARGAAQGLLEGGVLPVLKHIPGHGRAIADSHLALPVVDASARDLEALDFAPFRALADMPLAMTAHVRYLALDPDLPATLSPSIIGLIRTLIGFDGLVMSDDLSMAALQGDLGALARRSLAAGCDLVLHCNGRLPEMEAVVDAAGRLGPDARMRAGRAIAARRTPAPFDAAEALRELDAIRHG